MTHYIKFVVLTKSFKRTGFCVAGINLRTGKLIRPTNPNDREELDGALRNEDLVCSNGKKLECLDVVLLPIAAKEKKKVQPENYVLDKSSPLLFLQKVSIDDVLDKFPTDEGVENSILRSLCGKVKVGSKDDTFGDKSLSFIKVSDLNIDISYNEKKGKSDKMCSFVYEERQYDGFYVTDPNYTKKGQYHFDNAYLVLSTGNPYLGYFYKWVAAIYPC